VIFNPPAECMLLWLIELCRPSHAEKRAKGHLHWPIESSLSEKWK